MKNKILGIILMSIFECFSLAARAQHFVSEAIMSMQPGLNGELTASLAGTDVNVYLTEGHILVVYKSTDDQILTRNYSINGQVEDGRPIYHDAQGVDYMVEVSKSGGMLFQLMYNGTSKKQGYYIDELSEVK